MKTRSTGSMRTKPAADFLTSVAVETTMPTCSCSTKQVMMSDRLTRFRQSLGHRRRGSYSGSPMGAPPRRVYPSQVLGGLGGRGGMDRATPYTLIASGFILVSLIPCAWAQYSTYPAPAPTYVAPAPPPPAYAAPAPAYAAPPPCSYVPGGWGGAARGAAAGAVGGAIAGNAGAGAAAGAAIGGMASAARRSSARAYGQCY